MTATYIGPVPPPATDDFADVLVREVERWVGTPYHKTMRVLGVGVDCLNLMSGPLFSLGVIGDVPPYDYDAGFWNTDEDLIRDGIDYGFRAMRQGFVAMRASDPIPGDFVTYRTIGGKNKPNHAAWVRAGREPDLVIIHSPVKIGGGAVEMCTVSTGWKRFDCWRIRRAS